MILDRKSALIGAAAAAASCLFVLAAYLIWSWAAPPKDDGAGRKSEEPRGAKVIPAPPEKRHGDPLAALAVELSPSELEKFKVQPVAEREFTILRETVGTIDFNQEMSVQIFAPFQGKIIELFAKAGDDAQRGKMLFTIDSPDLLQAESTLLSAAGSFNLTTRNLERAKQLYEIQGISQKDLDQAASDQQAAEGALKAARNAVRIFGKTDADIDRIVAERRIDSVLAVHSPISGRITARNAAPGQLVQPGTAPAPFAVSDVSTKWLVASVSEIDIPLVRLGQQLDVTVLAYPNRVYRGEIVNIGASVDSNTHRAQVRSQVRDPKQELRPGMFARYVIRTGKATRSPAVPNAGVVREGDGTMTVWVAEGRRLVKREVKTGLQQDGYTQILGGLKAGEPVATENAIFLNNALTAASR
jgi:cobalt-zinc-cadmium efflux system membrane fusion protein